MYHTSVELVCSTPDEPRELLLVWGYDDECLLSIRNGGVIMYFNFRHNFPRGGDY